MTQDHARQATKPTLHLAPRSQTLRTSASPTCHSPRAGSETILKFLVITRALRDQVLPRLANRRRGLRAQGLRGGFWPSPPPCRKGRALLRPCEITPDVPDVVMARRRAHILQFLPSCELAQAPSPSTRLRGETSRPPLIVATGFRCLALRPVRPPAALLCWRCAGAEPATSQRPRTPR